MDGEGGNLGPNGGWNSEGSLAVKASMKTFTLIVLVVIAGGSGVGMRAMAEGDAAAISAASTQGEMSSKEAELEAAAASVLKMDRTNDHALFRIAVYDLVRVYGPAGADRVVEWYDNPARSNLRSYMIPALAQQSTEKTRRLLLRLAKEHDYFFQYIPNDFFLEHFVDYDREQKQEVAVMARKILDEPPAATDHSQWSSMACILLLGLNADKQDIPRIEKAGKLTIAGEVSPGWNAWASRMALARMGDETAHAAILAKLNEKTPPNPDAGVLRRDIETAPQIKAAIDAVRYVGRRDDVAALLPLLEDKRLTETAYQITNAAVWTTGKAVDVEAAQAIYALIQPAPGWPLTAPDGKVRGTGKHPKSISLSERHMNNGSTFETLAPEQVAEIKASAKEHLPAAK